ncbi:30S ribosomal protein S5 [uncultured archaeon]|nr:30S ribosomal protein S5 [uncultured archaeon]
MGRPEFRQKRTPSEEAEMARVREERLKQQHAKSLEDWKPKTKLGKLVKEKKIKDLDEALKYKILEPEIVDLLTETRSDILNIGQAKGKFGGGKRRAWRQTQRKTAEGNVPTFSCMVVAGNGDGYIGMGYGRAKETLPARAKALRLAKLNIMKIKRACASFDCVCGEEHTVPFIVTGKCGSCTVKLIPAPQGTGLVIGDECKKILRIAGVRDVYSKTSGSKRTTINLARACIDALNKTNRM